MSRARIISGMFATALFVTVGCGSSDSTADPAVSVAGEGSESTSDFNDADVMFAQMMIPHHEQAIELADIALDPQVGASEAVRALAQQIKGAQDPEIDQMTSLLTAWGQPIAMDADMDHSTMMSGMLTIEQLDALSQLSGTEFDQAWLEAMIAHHEGAIEMGQDALDDGSNAEVRALAEQIISGQQAEIDEMRSLLG